jgi:hypothetical protein
MSCGHVVRAMSTTLRFAVGPHDPWPPEQDRGTPWAQHFMADSPASAPDAAAENRRPADRLCSTGGESSRGEARWGAGTAGHAPCRRSSGGRAACCWSGGCGGPSCSCATARSAGTSYDAGTATARTGRSGTDREVHRPSAGFSDAITASTPLSSAMPR